MVRNYIKKRPERSYSLEDVRAAVNDVIGHRRSYRAAAKHYNVPRTVIFNRIRGRKTPMHILGGGRKNALSKEVEDQLADLISARAEFGYPMDKQELFTFVQDFCRDMKIQTTFKNNKPGQEWYSKFMKRYPRLSLKKPQNLENKRAEASDPFVVGDHFKNLKKIVDENRLDDFPELFFNCDESGFCTDPTKLKAIGIKNKALYQRIRGSGRENITINCCVSADGSTLPPHIIFQGSAVLPRWTGAGEDFPGTMYSATPKGYMEEPVFYNWFSDKFVPHVTAVKEGLSDAHPNQKALLMFDGHKSHISARLIQTALENNIILFRLPSHLTHRLQPLDFSVFGPLKKGWNKILLSEMRKYLGVANKNKMTKNQFSLAVKELWEKYLTPDIITSGFIGTGSLPVDPKKFPENYFDQAALSRYKASLRKHVTGDDDPLPEEPRINTEQDESLLPEEPEHNTVEENTAPENVPAFQPVPSTSKENVTNPIMILADCQVKRTAIDYYMNKIKANVQTLSAPVAKEKQIRLKQLQYGEVLTSEQVLERLRQEEERRKNKCTKQKPINKSSEKEKSPKKKRRKFVKESQDLETSSDPDIDNHFQEEMELDLENSDNDTISSENEYENELSFAGPSRSEKRLRKSNRIKEQIPHHDTLYDDLTNKKSLETVFQAFDNKIYLERDQSNIEQENSDLALDHPKIDSKDDNSRLENRLNRYFAICSIKTWYIGQVTEVSDGEAVVMKFLERVGSYFRWPKTNKIESVSVESIITEVSVEGDTRITIHPSIEAIQKLWTKARASI